MSVKAAEVSRWVNENVDFERLFRDVIQLEKMTVNDQEIRGVCPLHEGADNPTSFRFSLKSKTYACYSHHCEDKHGRTLISLVKGVKGCNSNKALHIIEDFVGDHYNPDIYENERKTKREVMWESNISYLSLSEPVVKSLNERLVAQFCANRHPYFLQRGYSQETLDHFEIGYALEGQLAGRLTIPVRDESGRLVMLAGRDPLFRDGDEKYGGKKYKNWWGCDKSSMLYNIHNVKDNPDGGMDRVIWIVEGYCCVWRAYDFGLKNVVACMGNKISRHQTKLLLSYATDIVIALDNDEAGQAGANKIISEIYDYANLYKVDLKYKDLSDYTDRSEFEEMRTSLIKIN